MEDYLNDSRKLGQQWTNIYSEPNVSWVKEFIDSEPSILKAEGE